VIMSPYSSRGERIGFALEYCINVMILILICTRMKNMLKASQLQRTQMEAYKDVLVKVIVGIH
jgi:hypothetical protein